MMKREIFEKIKPGFDKLHNGDYNGAIQSYNEAQEMYPDEIFIYILRANAKIEIEDFFGAIYDFTKAIEIDPDNFEAYNNRGIVKQRMGQFQEAIQDFSYAIHLGLENNEEMENLHNALCNRASAKFDQSDYAGVVEDCNYAIELSPQSSMAYKARGCAKYELSDNEGAYHDLVKAAEYGDSEATQIIEDLFE